jgi:hypothetical protein
LKILKGIGLNWNASFQDSYGEAKEEEDDNEQREEGEKGHIAKDAFESIEGLVDHDLMHFVEAMAAGSAVFTVDDDVGSEHGHCFQEGEEDQQIV